MKTSSRTVCAYIPVSALMQGGKVGPGLTLALAISECTRIAGGMSVATVDGKWVSKDTMLAEPVRLHKWVLFPGYDEPRWEKAIFSMMRALFALGEAEVMVEYTTSPTVIFFPEDIPDEPSDS